MVTKYPAADFKKVVATKGEIKKIIRRMAKEISRHYEGRKLLVCVILKGAFIFASDLVRMIKIPLEVTFIKASSYGSGSVSAGNVGVTEFFDFDKYKNYDILIVDDILDSGNTMDYLKEYFTGRGFSAVDFCALLDKPERREKEIYARYTGKRIENEFVVGYGLDYCEKYRNLPFIAVLDEKIYSGGF